MRHRETTLSYGPYLGSVYIYDSAGNVVSHPTQSETLTGLKWIDDCVIPGKKRILSHGGVLPFFPATIGKMEYTTVTPESWISYAWSGTALYKRTQVLSWYRLLPSFPTGMIPPPDAAAVSYVVNSAIASAKQEKFDLLTFYAEWHKSVEMLSFRMNQVFNFADKAKRKAQQAHTLKEARLRFDDYWLEQRFGWRPLLSDIRSICKQMQTKFHERQKGKEQVSANVLNYSNTTYANDGIIRQGFTTVGVAQRTYTGSALAVGTFGRTPELNPIQTTWELIPYSFVVDWFFDVASWVRAFQPVMGVDVPSQGYSIVLDQEWSYTVTTFTNPANLYGEYVTAATPSQQIWRSRVYERVPSSVQVPRLYPRLNTWKFVDLATLVIQRARPIFKLLSK